MTLAATTAGADPWWVEPAVTAAVMASAIAVTTVMANGRRARVDRQGYQQAGEDRMRALTSRQGERIAACAVISAICAATWRVDPPTSMVPPRRPPDQAGQLTSAGMTGGFGPERELEFAQIYLQALDNMAEEDGAEREAAGAALAESRQLFRRLIPIALEELRKVVADPTRSEEERRQAQEYIGQAQELGLE